ncbi:MAG: methyltransferase domain-containing protein [Siphonobacter sp.]
MNHEPKDEHMRELAQQLRCPDGEAGIHTGENMHINNAHMIEITIQSLSLADGDHVLEIGPGNGHHVPKLFTIVPNLEYTGIDISETMVQEARRFNAPDRITFDITDGQTIPFPDHSFDKIFTINTIYFWENPAAYCEEIYRCLKPGGTFHLTFVLKEFMEHLPFTQYGFVLYSNDASIDLLKNAAFSIQEVHQETEEITSNTSTPVHRTFALIIAKK